MDSYVIYKIDPNEDDLSGEMDLNKTSHGRLFLNCSLIVADGAIIFKDNDKSIKGVFSVNKYFVLEYRSR